MSGQLTAEHLKAILNAHKVCYRCQDTDEDEQVHALLGHIDAQQVEIDRLRALLGDAKEALERWTNLSDISGEQYREKYDCLTYACAVDCFEKRARVLITKLAEALS